jgi:hypothetical protein
MSLSRKYRREFLRDKPAGVEQQLGCGRILLARQFDHIKTASYGSCCTVRDACICRDNKSRWSSEMTSSSSNGQTRRKAGTQSHGPAEARQLRRVARLPKG